MSHIASDRFRRCSLFVNETIPNLLEVFGCKLPHLEFKQIIV